MQPFRWRNGTLHCEDVPLDRLAEFVETPSYVYSATALRSRARALKAALGDTPHLACFSVKACSNLAILSLLREEGLGFDIVSGGELYRVRRAGAPGRQVVFSGVGKSPQEVAEALQAKVLLLNVESEAELVMVNAVAEALGRTAPVSLRVNPEIDPGTHPYVATGLRDSKFGIPVDRIDQVVALTRRLPHLELIGLDCHIGSQLTDLGPFEAAAMRMRALAERLIRQGVALRYLDLGGGLGVSYEGGAAPSVREWARILRREVRGLGVTLIVEPGRWLVAPTAVLLTRALLEKTADSKQFVVVDAGMNDLVRPALYDAHHEVVPVLRSRRKRRTVDIVGPVCESGDFLARERLLPAVHPGELLAVLDTGAYGFSMASSYNSRPRACEVLVECDRFRVVRERETYRDLVRGEHS